MTGTERPFVGVGEIRGLVRSVNLSGAHAFSKAPQTSIRLLEGLGVEGDAHCGTTVKHRSRLRKSPTEPNLRQVHLLHTELFAEVAAAGHPLRPGDLGENVTTAGIDLLALPLSTVLRLGDSAEVRITGLRNPCSQIEGFQHGLLKHMLARRENGDIVRKTGVMAVVRRAGVVRAGDAIVVVLPARPHLALDRV